MTRQESCTECDALVPLNELKVGDYVSCPECGTVHVINEQWYEDEGYVEYIEVT